MTTKQAISLMEPIYKWSLDRDDRNEEDGQT